MDILQQIQSAYADYWAYFRAEVLLETKPIWKNYFWWLFALSAFFLALEWARPWRKEQPKFRKDFWLDFFYMFFNFFFFSLLLYAAASTVVVSAFETLVRSLSGWELSKIHLLQYLPYWAVLLVGFVLRDFVQWNVHRLLHRFAWLWEFHKVHHSVEQMGFAAHLRYHWMETIVYRSIEYLPLAILGVGLHEFFAMHIFAVAVGHYNHTNFYLNPSAKGLVFGAALGAFVGFMVLELPFLWASLACIGAGAVLGFLLRPIWAYIFNSPEMHIWHHAYELPANRPHGVNFGITLALWDYLWGTNYIPHDGRDIRLGFADMEQFPKDFVQQSMHGILK